MDSIIIYCHLLAKSAGCSQRLPTTKAEIPSSDQVESQIALAGVFLGNVQFSVLSKTAHATVQVNYFATPPKDQGSLTIPQFIHSRFEGCYCHCYSILLSLFKIHICLPSLLSLYGSTRKSAGRCRCAARCRSGLENRSAKLLGQLAYQCSGAVERNLQYKSLTERERCSAMTKANSECDEEKSRD